MQGMKLTTHIHLVLQIMKKWDITYIMLNEHMESFIITKCVKGNIKKPYRISILNFSHCICLDCNTILYFCVNVAVPHDFPTYDQHNSAYSCLFITQVLFFLSYLDTGMTQQLRLCIWVCPPSSFFHEKTMFQKWVPFLSTVRQDTMS